MWIEWEIRCKTIIKWQIATTLRLFVSVVVCLSILNSRLSESLSLSENVSIFWNLVFRMRFYHWFWWHIYLLLLLLAIILFWFLFWLDYMRAYSSSQNSIVLVTRLRYYSGWFSHWIALLCFLTCTQNERNETRKEQVAKAYTTWLSSSCRTALYHDVARLLLLVCRLIACRFTLMWFNRLGLVFSSENVLAIAYLIKRNFKWNNAQQVMLFTFFSLQLSQLTEYQITQTPSPQFSLTPSLSLSFVLSFILCFFALCFLFCLYHL